MAHTKRSRNKRLADTLILFLTTRFKMPIRLMVIAPAVGAVAANTPPAHSQQKDASEKRPLALPELLQLPPPPLESLPITPANLLCAAGTSDSDVLSPEKALSTVQFWADHVRSETDRHTYRFRESPTEYYNSEGFFRMLMLAVVLQEKFHVHYLLGSSSSEAMSGDCDCSAK